MVSQLPSTRGPALRFAPEPFQAELAGWLNFGAIPNNELLWAILCNDLAKVFALAPHNWALVHATLVWLLNFAPPGSYGSPDRVAAWGDAHEAPVPRIPLGRRIDARRRA